MAWRMWGAHLKRGQQKRWWKAVGRLDLIGSLEMDEYLSARTRIFLRDFLADTSVIGSVYAERHTELGVTGVRFVQAMEVQDTVKCLAALNLHYDGLAQLSGLTERAQRSVLDREASDHGVTTPRSAMHTLKPA